MPLIMNGTLIKEVWANGIRCDVVHMNGVEVHRRAFEANITLSGETFNFHLNNHLTSLGWDGEQPVDCDITVSGPVGSGSNVFGAFWILGLPAGSDVRLVVTSTGSISGGGGRGAVTAPNTAPPPGDPGGDGLVVLPQLAGTVIRVQNDGFIAGGGGGGGGWVLDNVTLGGGGGAGRVPGPAGVGNHTPHPSPGTHTSGGMGTTITFGGYSGGGGSLGQPGYSAYKMYDDPMVSAGGAAGRAVVGDNQITWDKVGTIYGGRVNS